MASSSAAARVLDLNEYRRRREEQRPLREREKPAVMPVWVPVLYWVPVWAP